LGRSLVNTFRNFHVLGLGCTRGNENIRKCDLTNEKETIEMVRSFSPNIIIHAAAERRIDIAEKDKERFLTFLFLFELF
jgi:S-adenosylmethionine synthetase